jgi:hypothetical protein
MKLKIEATCHMSGAEGRQTPMINLGFQTFKIAFLGGAGIIHLLWVMSRLPH